MTALISVATVVAIYTFVGNSGVLSFGHISFFAVGVWAAGVLSVPESEKPATMPYLFHFLATTTVGNVPSLVIAAAVGGVFALLVGLPLMRLSGLAAGIATFAVLGITNNLLRYYEKIGPGLNTFSSVPETTGLLQATVGAVIVIVAAFAYQKSRFGRQLRAGREDPAAARAVGISIYRQRLAAFAISGFMAGFAGGLYIHFIPINVDSVYLDLTFITLAMLVIGGVGSLWGAVVGALFVSVLDSVLAEAENGLTFLGQSDQPPGRIAHRRRERGHGARARPAAERTHGREGVLPRLAGAYSAGPPTGPGGGRMRICVVGCGAVGSLFAANLAGLEGVEVWGYDLARAHVDAINENGLRLTGAGDVVGHPRATTEAAEIPSCELGIVATKAMHTEAAISAVAHAFSDGAVASVQNGVGNEEVIARHVGRVIRGTTFPAGKILEPGVVQWDVKGDTTLGPFEPSPAAADEIELLADLCTRAGMPTQAVGDARPAQWRKVVFNAASNPIGALTGLTHGRVCERPDLRRLVSVLVDEGKAVAAAQGIVLDADPEQLIDHAARPDVAYDHKASMLQDVEARRATEIDYLNGGIGRFGRELGVPTPLNDAITALIKGLEASWET